jgi:hypothetical protein
VLGLGRDSARRLQWDRAPDMSELMRRYVVTSLATEAPFDPRDPDGVFVLKPWKDPAALRALMTYRDNCYPELRRDLAAWISVIETGPVVRGGVGRRNESHLRPGERTSVRGRATSRGGRSRPARRRSTGKRRRR